MIQKHKLITETAKYINVRQDYVPYAVTIKPRIQLMKKVYYMYRVSIVDELIHSIIKSYDSHLIRHPDRKSNRHRLIRSDNAIETVTKHGNQEIPRSHGIWGIHKDLNHRFNDALHAKVRSKATLEVDGKRLCFSDCIDSIHFKETSFRPFFEDGLVTSEAERWLDYAYKGISRSDDYSFVRTPIPITESHSPRRRKICTQRPTQPLNRAGSSVSVTSTSSIEKSEAIRNLRKSTSPTHVRTPTRNSTSL